MNRLTFDAGLLLMQEKFKADDRYYKRRREWRDRNLEMRLLDAEAFREAVWECPAMLDARNPSPEEMLGHVPDYTMYLIENKERNRLHGHEFMAHRQELTLREWVAVKTFRPGALVPLHAFFGSGREPRPPRVEYHGDDGSCTIWVE